jgi:hypothetical protein
MRPVEFVPQEIYSSGLIYESIPQKMAKISGFIQYLETKGLKPLNTRVGEYLRFFERLVSHKCSEEEIRTKLVSVIREIDEWLWVYKGLLIKEPKNIFDLVDKAMGGPHLARDENENTFPRNTQLELRICSYFLQNGFEVDVSSSSDLIVQVNEVPVFVECKRLNSPTQVLKRAKEAKKQLHKRYKSINGPSNGIVVLDVSRVIQPSQGLAILPNYPVAKGEIQAQILAFNDKFNTSKIFAEDDKLLFVWMQAIVATWIASDKEPGTRFSSVHTIYAKKDKRSWGLWETIKPLLETT